MIRAFQGTQPKMDETAFVEETAEVIGDVRIGARAARVSQPERPPARPAPRLRASNSGY